MNRMASSVPQKSLMWSRNPDVKQGPGVTHFEIKSKGGTWFFTF